MPDFHENKKLNNSSDFSFNLTEIF